MSYYARVEPIRPRMRFSAIEIRQILIAVAVMTVAFALVQIGGVFGIELSLRQLGGVFVPYVLLGSFIAVVTAFLLHELAHKVVAQRYGCFAEFRYYPMGLALGLLTAAAGFIFAAPGAVVISGPVTPRQHVRISAAGPGTNIALAALFIGLSFGFGLRGTLTTIRAFFGPVAFVNLFLGGFNLIPFPPLDGSKVFAVHKPLWAAMIATIVALYVIGSRLGVFVL